jgi:hypothetical protein
MSAKSAQTWVGSCFWLLWINIGLFPRLVAVMACKCPRICSWNNRRQTLHNEILYLPAWGPCHFPGFHTEAFLAACLRPRLDLVDNEIQQRLQLASGLGSNIFSRTPRPPKSTHRVKQLLQASVWDGKLQQTLKSFAIEATGRRKPNRTPIKPQFLSPHVRDGPSPHRTCEIQCHLSWSSKRDLVGWQEAHSLSPIIQMVPRCLAEVAGRLSGMHGQLCKTPNNNLHNNPPAITSMPTFRLRCCAREAGRRRHALLSQLHYQSCVGLRPQLC